ncbi:MAG TPA: nucleoside triphosphate pyrophosphohydrolase [Bacteroidetes bacterium]|nr:nucleoside triphosphate pyrophosphohydrolase [Bacteroidota bacterium]
MNNSQELPDYLQAFDRLVHIMDDLREKCPWDREQTFESLRKLTIEEAYELADAIVKKDMEEIKIETGDLLLHIVFYAKLAQEENAFTLAEIINTLCEKLIYRHPHVYGDTKANTAAKVLENWEHLKLKEKNNKKHSVLSGVPSSLPAMIKALRIQEKVSGIGFDWENREDVWKKLDEEIREVKEQAADKESSLQKEQLETEFGDLLFSVINAARLYGVDPEVALERTNAKFIRRFTEMENMTRQEKKTFSDLSLKEMDALWEKTKENEDH